MQPICGCTAVKWWGWEENPGLHDFTAHLFLIHSLLLFTEPCLGLPWISLCEPESMRRPDGALADPLPQGSQGLGLGPWSLSLSLLHIQWEVPWTLRRENAGRWICSSPSISVQLGTSLASLLGPLLLLDDWKRAEESEESRYLIPGLWQAAICHVAIGHFLLCRSVFWPGRWKLVEFKKCRRLT